MKDKCILFIKMLCWCDYYFTVALNIWNNQQPLIIISNKILHILCTSKVQFVVIKELEHRQLDLQVRILIYELGKSLSKNCDVKWLTLKHFLTTYLKRWKMHVLWGKSFLCPWTGKWFHLIMNVILEMSWFVHIFLQN